MRGLDPTKLNVKFPVTKWQVVIAASVVQAMITGLSAVARTGTADEMRACVKECITTLQDVLDNAR